MRITAINVDMMTIATSSSNMSVPLRRRPTQVKTWFWWLFLYVLMNLAATPDDASASPDAACSGLHSKPLDAASWRVLAPYHPGGCLGLGHRWCCGMPWPQTQLLASTYHIKRGANQLGFFVNQRIIVETRTISMTNVLCIICEDLMMLRFSNTKSSMLYNLLSVDEV